MHLGSVSLRLHQHFKPHGKEPDLFKHLCSLNEDDPIILGSGNKYFDRLRKQRDARAYERDTLGHRHEEIGEFPNHLEKRLEKIVGLMEPLL